MHGLIHICVFTYMCNLNVLCVYVFLHVGEGVHFLHVYMCITYVCVCVCVNVF